METFSALLAICAVTGEFPAQRPVKQSFDFFICAWLNGSVNNHEAGDLRRHRAHDDVIIMIFSPSNDYPLKCMRVAQQQFGIIWSVQRKLISNYH